MSHGPNHPCAPKTSTKISPEMTGDTPNGMSISVTSTFLPRELEFRDGPGSGEAEDQVQGHGNAHSEQRELNGARGCSDLRIASR